MGREPRTLLCSMSLLRAALSTILIAQVTLGNDHPGFAKWLEDNVNEFENVAIAWSNASAVPQWLKGTYFKNGPARMNFGGEVSYANMADGWARSISLMLMLLGCAGQASSWPPRLTRSAWPQRSCCLR